MNNTAFAEILKEINNDLQNIKIKNLFDVTEQNITQAQNQQRDLIHKIATIRKQIMKER